MVPQQHSTGGQTRLLGLSKRGESYVRKLLIHGARATLRWVKLKTDERSRWIRGVLERRGGHRTAVAVANKNARIVWALLRRGGVYGDNASDSGSQVQGGNRQEEKAPPARCAVKSFHGEKARQKQPPLTSEG